MLVRCPRLAPNTTAADSAVTASTDPSSAVRAGTAARPWPRSRALPTPMSALGGAPALASSTLVRDGRRTRAASPSPRTARRAVLTVGQVPRASTARTATPAPGASVAVSNVKPLDSSAIRARPTGVSGDSRTASPVPMTAPATATSSVAIMPTAASCRQVAPRAR